jgi:hypothetical protein
MSYLKKHLYWEKNQKGVVRLSVSCDTFAFRTRVVWTCRPARALCSHTETACFSSAFPRAHGPTLASHGNHMHEALTATVGGNDRSVPLQHMQHLIYFWNIQMKHLQYTSKTTETLATYVWNTCENAWKHLKAVVSICNIHIKHLQYMHETYAISR